jgi:uncharacterized membrane protein YheB (UPF0754 family)
MDLKLLLPPVFGAIIGWSANYLAIKLLFKPHLPVDILGMRLQGFIPKRRKDISRTLARAVENELLSTEDLALALNNIDWKEEIEKTIEEVVEHRFSSPKLKKFPVIGVVSENLKYHIKYLLTKEVLRGIDKKKGTLAAKFRENIDIKELLVSKIDRLDLVKFEGGLTDFMASELKHLGLFGAAVGFMLGLIQSGIIYLLR